MNLYCIAEKGVESFCFQVNGWIIVGFLLFLFIAIGFWLSQWFSLMLRSVGDDKMILEISFIIIAYLVGLYTGYKSFGNTV